jgi:ferredoxin
MAITVNASRCPQNHRCPLLSVCPAEAITQERYGLPVIDKTKCAECGICTTGCPMGAVKMN